MSFSFEREVKSSKKACHCYWCGQVITVGCPKITIASVWEGDFFFTKLHPECREALSLWQEKYREEYWPEEGSMDRGKITGQEYEFIHPTTQEPLSDLSQTGYLTPKP